MTYSFNLVDRKWIPCLTLDGMREEFGIRDVLVQAHELREIRGDTPLETAALYRLLLAVLHRVFGPKSSRAWKSLWAQPQFKANELDNYLQRSEIHQCFDLFHPQKPFYQPCRQLGNNVVEIPENTPKRKGKMSLREFLNDSRREEVTPTSVISLLLHTASGGNAVLFDHSTEVIGLSLTPAQAARALITSQLFGFGGTSGVKENFTDAPGSKGVLFFAQGQNLFKTLILNMLEYGEDKPLPTPDDDQPAWEMENPFIPKRTRPKGYLDYLTWHNRYIWLRPQEVEGQVVVRDMYWAPGLKLDAEGVDPMMHYFVDEKKGEIKALSFTTNRALWRDSKVLFELGGVNKPPKVVQWLARLASPPILALDVTQQYQLIALGIAKNKGKLEFLRSESLPLPINFLKNPDLVGKLGRALQIASGCASAIRRASFVLAWLTLYPATKSEDLKTSNQINTKIKSGRYKRSKDEQAKRIYNLATSWDIERYYWSDLGIHFHTLIEDLSNTRDLALQIWRNQIRKTATAAFQQAEKSAGKDTRTMRAVAIARQRFYIELAAIIGKVNPKNSTQGGDEA